MPLKTTPLDDLPALNLTAMIDVLFLLIIFFVVGTKFIESERQIDLEVPRVKDRANLPAAEQRKIVNVYEDGEITLDHKPLGLDDLTRQLAAARGENKQQGVLVRGDAGARFEQVAKVLNACKQAGISELGISVRLAEAEHKHARR